MKKQLIHIIDSFFLLRPVLLAPVWTIVILGWIVNSPQLSLGSLPWNAIGAAAHEYSLWKLVGGFSLIVAWIYLVNQIMDVESDRINHKLFILSDGLVSIRSAWIQAVLFAVCGVGIAVTVGLVIAILFVIGIVLGYLYNCPPVKLKNSAWGGLFANALGHGIVTFLIGWCGAAIALGKELSLVQGLVSSLSPALGNAAIYLATTIPDCDGDEKTGKKTFCVVYGARSTAVVALVACLLTFGLSFLMASHQWIMAVPAGISLLFFGYFAIKPKGTAAFKAIKWPVFILSLCMAVYFPLYALLILFVFVVTRTYYHCRFKISYPTFKSR